MKKIKGCLKSVANRSISLLKGIIRLVMYNPLQLFTYALLCTFLCGLCMYSFKALMLELSFYFYGSPYIEPDNVFGFYLHPVTIILMLIMDLIIGYSMMFEVSGLLYVYRCSYNKEKVKFGNIILSAITSCNRILKPRNWMFLLFFLLIVPFSATIPLSVVGVAVRLPEFIRDFIIANSVLRVVYIVFLVLLVFFALSLIFIFPRFVNERKSVKESAKFSWQLTKGRKVKTYLGFILVSFLSSALIYIVSVGVFALYVFVKAYITDTPLTGSLISGYSNYMNILNTVLICIILPQVTCGTLSYLYFKYSAEDKISCESKSEKFNHPKLKMTAFFVCIAIVLSVTSYVLVPTYGDFFAKSDRPVVGAHRGDSVRAPENTLPAFELAASENAKLLELDIFQTADKQLVVCHDDNLTRVAGKSAYVHEMTLDELKKLDVGSWFSEDYSDVKISSLSEVLQTVKGKFDTVQIEIKYTGYEEHLEEELISLIDKYDMRNEVLVISLEAEPLIRIKEIDKGIKTGYCMFVAMGDLSQIEFSDDISIEESNVDPLVVAELHNNGKKVYTWTCNTADNVQWLLDCGVDGILTDDPIMLEDALNNCDYSGGFARLLRVLFYSLRNGY